MGIFAHFKTRDFVQRVSSVFSLFLNNQAFRFEHILKSLLEKKKKNKKKKIIRI